MTKMKEIQYFAGWIAVSSLILAALSVLERIFIGPLLVGCRFYFGEFVSAGAIWLVIKCEEKM